MPERWREGLIVPILKKGDSKKCENYRGITLLNTSYKILTSLILRKLKIYTEPEFGEYQHGFRQGRSTIDAIYIRNQIIQKCYEKNIELQILFIDFKQAFDSLKRQVVIEDGKRLGIPNKILRLIQRTMKDSRAAVFSSGEMSEKFEINKGVRQGDGLSATIFNIAVEGVMRACNISGSIIEKSVQIVAYADDLAIIARDSRSLKETLLRVKTEATKRGLEINQEKTKYMEIERRKRNDNIKEVEIGNFRFEKVENFKYLGSIINNKNERSIELKQRIQAGHKAYHKYKTFMKHNRISKNTKLRIYKTAIRPVVTYGAEAMCLTKKDEEISNIFERKIMRRISGPIKINEEEYRRLMNYEIEEMMKGESIVKIIKSQRIRWYGHVNRRKESSMLKRITKWRPDENRMRGRPKTRCEDQVIQDLKSIGVNNWNNKLHNRREWRRIVEESKTHKKL